MSDPLSRGLPAHEHQLGYTEARVAGDDPAKTIEQPSDDRVVRRDGGDEAGETTLLRRIEERGDERGANALPLPVVLNDDGHLRRRLVDGAETRKRHHSGATGPLIFSEHRETSTMVDACETAHDHIGQSRDRRQESQIACTRTQTRVKHANRPLFMTV